MSKVDTIFLADMHVGHPAQTQTRQLVAFLELLETRHSPKRYVSVGDGIDTRAVLQYGHQAKLEDVVTFTHVIAQLPFIFLSGNHDEDISDAIAAGHTTYQADVAAHRAKCPRLSSILAPLHGHVSVANEMVWQDCFIAHGHEQEYLWRMARQIEKVMGKPIPKPQHASLEHKQRVFELTGFHRRFAQDTAHMGLAKGIHGHTHTPGMVIKHGISLVCLPDWLQHNGGALIGYDDGHMDMVYPDGRSEPAFE